MDMKSVERKWQAKWEKSKQNSFNKKNVDKKWYVLEMFSYPSGAKLHVGHWYNYGPTDSYARFKKLQGYEVFQPIGFDAFGLPAENYAIKTGIHPKDSTEKNIATMEQQLHDIGAMFDWSAEVRPATRNIIAGRSGSFSSSIKKGLPIARRRSSTGVPPAKRCLPTSRSWTESANAAAKPW